MNLRTGMLIPFPKYIVAPPGLRLAGVKRHLSIRSSFATCLKNFPNCWGEDSQIFWSELRDCKDLSHSIVLPFVNDTNCSFPNWRLFFGETTRMAAWDWLRLKSPGKARSDHNSLKISPGLNMQSNPISISTANNSHSLRWGCVQTRACPLASPIMKTQSGMGSGARNLVDFCSSQTRRFSQGVDRFFRKLGYTCCTHSRPCLTVLSVVFGALWCREITYCPNTSSAAFGCLRSVASRRLYSFRQNTSKSRIPFIKRPRYSGENRLSLKSAWDFGKSFSSSTPIAVLKRGMADFVNNEMQNQLKCTCISQNDPFKKLKSTCL